MIFKLIAPNKLKILLSSLDMQMLGVTYDSLDYKNPETKALLIELLAQGRAQTGFSPGKTKLFIEAYPEPDGGCSILFTALTPAESDSFAPKYATGPVVFAFTDIDLVIQAAVKLFQQYGHRIYKSSLYRLDHEYRLIIHPLDRADQVTLNFLQEYAPIVGEGEIAAAFVCEHGIPIVEDSAIDVMSAYLS